MTPAQWVYEGFQYDDVGDSLEGQADDPGVTDTDATGLSGAWVDAIGGSANMFLKTDSLAFGDLSTSGNHVGFQDNSNNDIFHRTLTPGAEMSGFIRPLASTVTGPRLEDPAITSLMLVEPTVNEAS